VLNLFDIVRCYEQRDTGRKTIGTTTLSEAQLIGRGARYCPFILPENNDRFRRKFDGDLGHELRVLEELHYHSINDSRYISEIRQALVEQGMMDEREVVRKLTLKDSFKKTAFYKYGVIYLNDRHPKDYQRIHSFSDLGVKKRNYNHFIATGHGGMTTALENGQSRAVIRDQNREDIKVSEIERNIIQSAIARNPFFTFASLKRFFPNLTSMREFITSSDYLGGLEITFQGDFYALEYNYVAKLDAMLGLLQQIESEVRQQITDYEGSRDFRPDMIHEVFKDKILKFDSANRRGDIDETFEHLVSTKEWFAFNTIYGTSEEKAFVQMLDRQMHELHADYEQIYLLRNEGHFAIYNFSDGQTFQPDFVLFLQEKNGTLITYQLFIEPKGKHLQSHDKWKKEFLAEITKEFEEKLLRINNKKYRLIGVPFYNNQDENKFRESLESVLK